MTYFLFGSLFKKKKKKTEILKDRNCVTGILKEEIFVKVSWEEDAGFSIMC